MQTRLAKLEEARITILEKIIKSYQQKSVIGNKTYLLEAFLMLKKTNLLIIGKDNRFLVNNLNNQILEDMLNILYQYGLILKRERVCGNVFRVLLRINPSAKAKIISINNISNTKAA